MRRKLRGYRDDEDGSHTIEFVLWVPIFILILSLVVDVCFLFLAQSRMFDVASDATRQLAIRLEKPRQRQAETYAIVTTRHSAVSIATAPMPTAALQPAIAKSRSTLPSRDVAVTGVLNFLATDKLTATVRQLKEGS